MSADFAIPGLMPLTAPFAETEAPMPSVLEPHSLSQTLWQGIQSIGPYTINGDPPLFAAEKITMILTCPSWPCVSYVISSDEDEDGAATIMDPDLWWFVVEEQALPLYPGLWDWKILVTDTRGEVTPIFYGVLPITP